MFIRLTQLQDPKGFTKLFPLKVYTDTLTRAMLFQKMEYGKTAQLCYYYFMVLTPPTKNQER